MTKIVGIDLGTTFSAIAVDGKVELTPGYPEPQYLEECDVSIIPDTYGNYIIPSALWEDPDQPGELIIGVEAKEAADNGYNPILFSKRNIGTDITYTLRDKIFTARDAAREILIYLKGIVEEALGERVDRAVITHPAYFDPAMKEETAEAAKEAGFNFDPEHHLLMEPIAAALAYTRTDDRDPLRTLTYDMGGGTFDVTAMERRQGVITVKAFGGDRLLGGFNFDRELAQWLLNRLQERGVQITLDKDNPEDQGKWKQLLRLAEDTKIQLAKARTDKMPVNIKQQNIFKDDNGVPINLLDKINRQQFTELIQELLDGTINGKGGEGETKGCNLVLAEVGWTIEQVDEILLVGGSTYAPWIPQTIETAWEREPKLCSDPDLYVAAGAAIHSTTGVEIISSTSFQIELDIPKQSVLDSINISGRVLTVGNTELPSDLQVLLINDGIKTPTDVDAEGNFLFEDVELEFEATTKFTLEFSDSEGRKVVEHQFEINHNSESSGENIGVLTVLPKPLFIEVVGGMKPLAEEGATLPANCEVELKRTNEENTIEIRLFQEADCIGSVIIEDVPKEAQIGSKVELAVEISPHNRISGHAKVFTRKGVLAKETSVNIRIPRMEIPDVQLLEAEWEQLEAEREERMIHEQDANRRLTMQAQGEKSKKKIIKSLKSPDPDRQEIWIELRKLKQLINPPKDEMQPPLEYFEQLVLKIKELLKEQSSDDQIQNFSKMLENLENEGRITHSKKDKKKWGQVITSLQNLLHRLEKPKSEGPEPEVPPTPLLKLYARMELDQTRQRLRVKETEFDQKGRLTEGIQGRLNRLREGIDSVEVAIDQIDDNTKPQSAQSQLQLIFLQKLKPIEDQISSDFIDTRG